MLKIWVLNIKQLGVMKKKKGKYLVLYYFAWLLGTESTSIQIENEFSNYTKIEWGGRRGGILSPDLFNLYRDNPQETRSPNRIY